MICPAVADGSDSTTSASERASLKSKLRLLSLKSSKSSQADAGPTYTPSRDTTPEERELLRQEYLMQHGRHIMGISTLQQEQLQHFVMPGERQQPEASRFASFTPVCGLARGGYGRLWPADMWTNKHVPAKAAGVAVAVQS